MDKDCRKIQEKLSEDLDDRLSPEEKQGMARHLEGCVSCREAAGELQAVRSLLKAAPPLTPPESFYDQVLRRLDEPPEPQAAPRISYFRSLKVLAAACVLMVTVLIFREPARVRFLSKAPARELARHNMDRLEEAPASPHAAAPPSGSVETYTGKGGKDQKQMDYAEEDARNEPLKKKSAAPKAVLKTEDSFERKDRASRDQEKLYEDEDPASPAEARQAEPSSSASAGDKAGRMMEENSAAAEPAPAPQALGAQLEAPDAKESSEIQNSMRGARRRSYLQDSPGWQGETSGISKPATWVVRDRAAWKDLWKRHGRTVEPPLDAPAVDFKNLMAVAVFAGQKPTGGYSISITEIRPLKDRIVVSYQESSPPEDAAVLQVLTAPYHILLTPRSELPVEFRKTR